MLVQSIPYPSGGSSVPGSDAALEFVGLTGTAYPGKQNSASLSLGYASSPGDIVFVHGSHDFPGNRPGDWGKPIIEGGTDIFTRSPGGGCVIVFAYYVCGSGETEITVYGGDQYGMGYAGQVWRGVDYTNLFAEALVDTAGDTGMPNPGALDVTSPPVLRMILGALDDDEVTMTAPSGFSNISTRHAASSSSALASMYDDTGGSVDPGAFGGGGNDQWGAYHFAFNIFNPPA